MKLKTNKMRKMNRKTMTLLARRDTIGMRQRIVVLKTNKILRVVKD